MVFLGMKRGREGELDTLTTMANCLMLLSRSGAFESSTTDSSSSRVFECKTCNRQFPSFQALGGHRASHKKPRLIGGELMNQQQTQSQSSPPKPKTHECSVCGLEFAIGQALGGHMRRHRAAANDGRASADLSLSSRSQSPVVNKSSNSSRRVLSLDLNLTPLENGLDFPMEKVAAPVLHCYL